MEPWHLAYTPGVRPARVVVDGEVVLDESGPTRVDAAEIRARAARRSAAPVLTTDGGACECARVALYLQDAHPIRDGMRYARQAEDAGFEAVWQAESRLVREATVPLAAFGAVTERIGLGSGVVSMWVRNPAFLAATFSTLDDLAPGRVTLGIGAWWDPLAAKVGISRDKPLRAMREYVTVVRGAPRQRDGHLRRRVRAPRRRRARLRAPGASAQGGADRDRRHRAADDEAGGRDRRRRAPQLPGVARRTTRVRSPHSPRAPPRRVARSTTSTGPQLVVCSMDDDRDAALDAARLLVTQYLGQQPHIMKASGVPEELLDEIGQVLTWPATHDDVVAASKLVPDDVVQLITASGTPDECRAKVAEYVATGCTCPVLYPLGDDVGAMIDAFADWTP